MRCKRSVEFQVYQKTEKKKKIFSKKVIPAIFKYTETCKIVKVN